MNKDLYLQTPYTEILKNIHGLEIPFDTSWKKISIAVSGGADSALLAWLICSLISKLSVPIEVHIISNIRNWKKKPWQQQNSINVYNYLVKNFKNIHFFRHENFVPPEIEWAAQGPTLIDEYGKIVSGDNIELRAFAEYICFCYNIDSYFNAVTKNPPGISGGMITRDIEPAAENIQLLAMEHMGKLASHPFRFTSKDWIIKKYNELNLKELLDLTRSCEGEFDGLDHTNYAPGETIPQCGKCFWCQERNWAIEQASK